MPGTVRRGLVALTLVAGGWLGVPAAQDLTLPLKADSVRFGVIGDNGTGATPQYDVGRQMAISQETFPFTFVIMMGDNLYGGERPQDFVKKFEAPYKVLLDRKVDFYASLGNHDDPNQRFYTPFNMAGKRYYSFKKGNVRFFALDSNYMDPVQLAWFEAELKNSGSDWKIAYFHHPLYSSGMHGSQTDLRTILEPLLINYSVDVVFSGHEHFYQRIKPQNGIHYFVSGAAGELRTGDIRPADMTAAGFDRDRSFMLVEVAGKELSFRAVSRTGQTVDQGTIVMRPAIRTTAANRDTQAPPGPATPAAIWRNPGRMSGLNLLYGSGGRAHAPDPKGTFTFVKEDDVATSPKFDVTDRMGIEWKVKLGEEPQSETAAARFLWAAGYFVDEDYYVSELRVSGLPKLQRGAERASSDGTIRGARLERKLKGAEKRGNWDWFDNPFTDSRELNGLRIMMALLNNWDLKDVNNSIYEAGGQRRYVVTDLGASFGNTGNSLTRSKSAPQEYADSQFIDKATPLHIDFVLHSRPFFMAAVNIPNYAMRTRIETIVKTIPRADAKWLGRRLASLSARQIGDGFRAGGYTAEEIAIFSQAVRARIAALNAL